MVIKGRLNDNKSALFKDSEKSNRQVSARLILNQNDGKDICLSDMVEDVTILVTMEEKKPKISCWQINYQDGGLNEIDIELIDIEKNIYQRLGGLSISSKLERKKVVMIGLGSVGSTAAIQLAKSGIGEMTFVDPDIIKMHNVIRHLCGLNDIGRKKVDAVAEKIMNINPNIKINIIPKDCVEAYEQHEKAFKNTDALIVSTDTSDSRSFINYLSVDLHIPSIHISYTIELDQGVFIEYCLK